MLQIKLRILIVYFERKGGHALNIVINAVFMHDNPRGVGRVSNNVLKKIAEYDKKNQYYIYYGVWQKYDFLRIKQFNIHFIPLHISPNAIWRNLYVSLILPLRIKKHNPDIYHIMDTSPVLIKTCPIISTIHDLAEFTVPKKYNFFKCRLRRLYVRGQVKRSDRIIAVSKYTKNDIVNRFHVSADKIDIIYNFFETNVFNEVERPYKKYFLVVGEIERTKNVGMIIEAFSKLSNNIAKDFKLYIVGKRGNDYAHVIRVVKECRVEKQVIFLDYVTDKKLFELYREAYALIFASLFEGFGLPVLEAMSFGIPVISSNATSMPEITGNAEMLFNPNIIDELCQCIIKIIQEPEKRLGMIREGYKEIERFSIEKIIISLLNIYYSYENKG